MVLAALLAYELDNCAAGLRPDPFDRRGHRTDLPAALVLVAHQRLVRDRRDERVVRRGDRLLHRRQARHARCRSTWRCSGRSRRPRSPGWSRRSSRPRPTAPRCWRSIARCARRARAGARFAPNPASGTSPDSLPQAFLAWICGIFTVYGALFGTGSLLYGRTGIGLFWVATGAVGALGLIRIVPRMWASPP